MAITAVDKNKINKYLKEHSIGDLYYLGMCDALGKRGKISDAEFLEYFTDCVVSEFGKSDKISINHLSKIILVIESFLGWMHESGSEIKENALDKIRSFKDFYEDYLNRTGFDVDLDFTDNYIGALLNTINELYPCEEKSESVTKYINRIAELDEHIVELKKKHAELTKLYGNLKASYTKKSNKVDALNKVIIDLKSNIGDSEEEITRLNEIIESLNVRISELETAYSQAQEENAVLAPYKEQCEILSTEVETLRKTIADGIKAEEKASDLKVKQSKIEALIYQKLLFERITIDEILQYVKEQGFSTNKDEVSYLLKNIRSKINVDDSCFSLSPMYKIIAPNILENGQFSVNVPNGCKYYDIMLVADLHIEDLNPKVLTGFDVLTDYCVKNGVPLVLHLGDFYEGIGYNYFDYENAIKNYNLVEQSIALIPKVDGIYHATLGGNHDKNITKYGFDPIGFLTSEREDFINLGYTHSTVVLNNSSNVLGKFDIHHPDIFKFPTSLDDNGIDISEIHEYLSGVYSEQSRSRDDSYIDIFGHIHKNQINYPDSYCFISQYFDGKSRKSATHLRIYFDDDTSIKYMIFMPLGGTSQLTKNNEIVYQKVLSK